jgi:hypothetical protein
MITINSLSNVVAADISGDLVTVLSTLLLAENPPLFELGQALNAYEQGLIAAAVPATEIQAIDPQQITELQQTIGQLQQTIAQQQTQLSQLVITNWDGLIDLLKAAGFNNWLAEAGADNPELLDEISRLYAAAKVGDRLGVIREYLEIAAQYPPSIDQLQGWQSVLDNFQPHPVPQNLLWFVR